GTEPPDVASPGNVAMGCRGAAEGPGNLGANDGFALPVLRPSISCCLATPSSTPTRSIRITAFNNPLGSHSRTRTGIGLMVRSAAKRRVPNNASRVSPTCALYMPISGKPEIGGPRQCERGHPPHPEEPVA